MASKLLAVNSILLFALIVTTIVARPVYAWDEVWENEYYPHRQGMNDWNSVWELEVFVALDDAPLVLIAGADGVINFDGQCEDYAFQLRNRAMLQGRHLDVEFITPIEYFAHFRKHIEPRTVHAINKAIIGNEVWFVDKGSGDIWYQYDLD